MLFWWYTFQKDAEGIFQMAISGLLAFLSLMLVAGATALHLGAVNEGLLGANTPARLVTLAAVINLTGKFFFPLMAPGVFQDIFQRALESKIINKAFKDAESKADDMAAQLADRVGEELTRRMQVQILTRFGVGHDNAKPTLIPSNAQTTTVRVHQKGGVTEHKAKVYPPPDGKDVMAEYTASEKPVDVPSGGVMLEKTTAVTPTPSPNGSTPKGNG